MRGFGIPRNLVKYNITINQAEETINKYKAEKFPIEKLRFNQAMPDEKLTIQGEILDRTEGPYLTYTRIKKPMNIALKEKEKAKGLQATRILKQNFFPSSYSDLQALQERHPSSVIELGSYSIPVGNIKGRNTIIWEVRDY